MGVPGAQSVDSAMANLIEDYAIIGNCRTAALVGRDGSIDWYCAPRFDSASCFGSLLGTEENGRWLLAPAEKAKIKRSYRGDTLILDTTYRTKTGTVRITDFMPRTKSERSSIVRVVTGIAGKVEMKCELVIRFDYGITIPWVNRQNRSTLTAVAGPNMLVLHTPVALRGEDMRTVGEFAVRRGESVSFALTYMRSYRPAEPPIRVKPALKQTEAAWRNWAKGCKPNGRWRKEIIRSLLTLKALTYEPTGGMVAAVTTSLPEQVGGPRNWDYRYCWLRDATFTLLAFMNAGLMEEALKWQTWLMRVIAGAPSQLQTMYGEIGRAHV